MGVALGEAMVGEGVWLGPGVLVAVCVLVGVYKNRYSVEVGLSLRGSRVSSTETLLGKLQPAMMKAILNRKIRYRKFPIPIFYTLILTYI